MAENITPQGSGRTLLEFQELKDIKSKLDWNWGLAISRYIRSTVTGANGYFFLRNQRIRRNRDIANGRMDAAKFQDFLGFSGEVNYANLNWSSLKVANTIISKVVSRWMSRNEKIVVQSTDADSRRKKNEQAALAEYYMINKSLLQAEEQATGVPMIPQDQFVAEDKDELDLWVNEFNQLPEEIKYSLGVNTIFRGNGLTSVQKAKLCHDAAEAGLVGTYTHINEQGEIVIERLIPENCFYSYSEYDDFRDTAWRGYLRSKKISEIRAKYSVEAGGKLTEEDIFKLAQTSKEYKLYDKITWVNEWNIAAIRPYDEWNIDVMEFELRSWDVEKYTVTQTKENKSTIVRKGVSEKIKDNQKVVEDRNWNIYRGVFAVNNNVLLEWGLKKNMIRPNDPKELGNAEFSYSFFMYQNYEGRNVAIPEKIELPLEQMQLAVLKLQQLVAKLKPAGHVVNVDALRAIDLGLSEPTTPLKIKQIFDQTGDLYYTGRDAEGNYLQTPITEAANSAFFNQAQGLIQIYQHYYQVLATELGENPNLSQDLSAPRVTTQNAQSAMVVAERATEHMYDAVLYVLEDTGRKVACLLADSVVYGAKVYRELVGEEDIKGKSFRADLQMLPTQEDAAKLELMVNDMILADPKFSMYVDPMKLKSMAKEDVRLAQLYFKRCQRKYLSTEAENQQKNIQAQNEGLAAIEQQKSANAMQFEQIKQSGETRKALVEGLMRIMQQGSQVPTELKQISDLLFGTLALQLSKEQQAVQEQIMAEEAEAQAMEQQAMMEEQPQQPMQ